MLAVMGGKVVVNSNPFVNEAGVPEISSEVMDVINTIYLQNWISKIYTRVVS